MNTDTSAPDLPVKVGTPTYVGSSVNPETEEFRLTVRLIQQFAAEVEESGATFVVLLFPMRRDVERAIRGERLSYEPLRAGLRAAGVEVVDIAEVLDVRTEGDALFADVHYSPEGNALVARAFGQWLDTR